MKLLAFIAIVFLAQPAFAGPGVATACASLATGCTNDTTNAHNLVTIINDPAVQRRIFNLWMGQCQNIYSESTSVTGHTNRVAFCQSIAAQKVPLDSLVSAVFSTSPTVVSQVLCTQGTSNDGCMVDADVNNAIGAVMTVTGTSGLATRTWP